MSNRQKKIVWIVIAIFIMGIFGYNFINQKKVKSKNLNIAKQQKEKHADNNKSQKAKAAVVDNENKKEREFKYGTLKYNNTSIPVVMYHSIDYEKGNELRVPKEKFREQMKYLKDNAYTTLSLDELYSFIINNKPIPEKSIVLTFDDGYKDNYNNAYPILKEFGFNATVFVITNCVDKEAAFLTSKQLKEMEKNKIDIESHTLNHDKLDKLSYDKQIETLKGSKEYLEKLLNKKIKYIGYPYGEYNDTAVKATKDTGYTMAFTTESGWANKNQGVYTLHRVYISANYNMEEFKRRITNVNYDTKK